jgi:hypothetical protein
LHLKAPWQATSNPDQGREPAEVGLGQPDARKMAAVREGLPEPIESREQLLERLLIGGLAVGEARRQTRSLTVRQLGSSSVSISGRSAVRQGSSEAVGKAPKAALNIPDDLGRLVVDDGPALAADQHRDCDPADVVGPGEAIDLVQRLAAERAVGETPARFGRPALIGPAGCDLPAP